MSRRTERQAHKLIYERISWAERGPHGDLMLTADRVAGMVVNTLADAGMLRPSRWWRTWFR